MYVINCDRNLTKHDIMFAHMPIIREIIFGAVNRGASLADLCQRLSIAPQDLHDSNKVVNFEQAYLVWEYAVKQTGDSLLGLHLGEQTSPSILGLIGHLMQSSGTLKQAFEKVCEHNHVVTDLFNYRFKESEKEVTLYYEPIELWMNVSPETARQAVGQAMAGTLSVFELLSGKKLYPIKALFNCKKPAQTKEYDRIFKSPLVFSAGSNALIFSTEQLATAVTSYDESLFALFDEILTERKSHRKKNASFTDEVSQIISSEFKGLVPPIEIIASRFSITTRTLQRRLKEEGSSYRELGNEIKKGLAVKLLKGNSKKVDEIAMMLGYAESSSFQRAFKSWSETTPGKIRRSA